MEGKRNGGIDNGGWDESQEASLNVKQMGWGGNKVGMGWRGGVGID